MNHLQRTIALTLILIVATLAPIALPVEGPPMPPYTTTPKASSTPTMFPSPSPSTLTATPLPTPEGTPYPFPTRRVPPTVTPTPPVYPYRQQWLPCVFVRSGQ
jgi:hypothetical protein